MGSLSYASYFASYSHSQLWIISVGLSLLNAFLCGLATLALRLSWIMVLTPPAPSIVDDSQHAAHPYHAHHHVMVCIPSEDDTTSTRTSRTNDYDKGDDKQQQQVAFSYQGDLALVTNHHPKQHPQRPGCKDLPLSTLSTTTTPAAPAATRPLYPTTDYARSSSTINHNSCNDYPQPYYCAWTIRCAALAQFTLITPLLDMVAVYFASPSIVTPSSGVALACVVLLAQPVLGERQDKIRVVGACLILWGEVLVAAFGDHVSNDQETVQEVVDSYSEPNFVLFLVVSALWMLLLFSWIIRCAEEDYRNPGLERFAWGVSGGYLAGLQNFIKDALTIWKLVGERQETAILWPWQLPWMFWLLVTLAATTAAAGLALMTFCMKRYDATYTSGTFAGALVVSSSVMSAIHYHTFDHLPLGWVALFYPLGLLTLLIGVVILTQCAHDEDDDNTIHNNSSLASNHHNSTETLTSHSNDNEIETACPRSTLIDPEMAKAVPIRKYT